MVWKNDLAPRLRHRVDIDELIDVITDPATGARSRTWLRVHTALAAEVVPSSGREFTAAQAVQAGVTTRISIRAIQNVVPRMRVVHDGAFYNIKAVLPDPTFRHHLTLMCETGVNDG